VPQSPRPAGTHSSLKDGGVVDRIGLKAWRNRRRRQGGAHSSSSTLAAPPPRGGRPGRRPPPCLVHIIERSSPFSGSDDPAATGESEVHVVRSPKSGVNFFDLGDFDLQFDAARRRARPMLEQLIVRAAPPGGAPSAAAAGASLAQPKAGGPGANFAPANSPLRPAGGGLAGRGVVVARRAAGGGVAGASGSGGAGGGV
jgi:hypothetical protein